jgi:hypothetical protein
MQWQQCFLKCLPTNSMGQHAKVLLRHEEYEETTRIIPIL